MMLQWHSGFDSALSLWFVESTSGQRTYLYRHCGEAVAKEIAARYNRRR